MNDQRPHLLRRIAPFETAAVTIYLDGVAVPARVGETVLTAALCHTDHVRLHDVDGTKRAGFCLMGACQDCWVWFSDGGGGRACTTFVRDGMRVATCPPSLP
jgi:D-hydroxyproline dehydrogenase subunit gamma